MYEAPDMSCLRGLLSPLTWALILITPLVAVDADRDFSGKWIFDPGSSNVRDLPTSAHEVLEITQGERAVNCASASSRWTYNLDGKESKYKIGDSSMNSMAKWEGAALLINTLVSGP